MTDPASRPLRRPAPAPLGALLAPLLALTLLSACQRSGGDAPLAPQQPPPAPAGIVASPASMAVATDGHCSLPEAILAANLDQPVNECPAGSGPDLIALTGGATYAASLASFQHEGPTALPAITSEIEIRGAATVAWTRPPTKGGGPAAARLFYVAANGDLTLTDATVRGGYLAAADGPGAALLNRGATHLDGTRFDDHDHVGGSGGIVVNGGTLDAVDCVFADNASRFVAPIVNLASGAFTMERCTYSGGWSEHGASVLYNAGSAAIEGSLVRDSRTGEEAIAAIRTTGDLAVRGSTLLDLEGDNGAWVIANTDGGQLVVENSTVSATPPGPAIASVAVRSDGASWADVRHVTIQGYIGFFVAHGAISHTVVDGDDGWVCHQTPASVSLGWNVLSDASCGFASPGDQQGLDPRLAPLADNGGPTPTHALLATSPALDAGDPAFTAPPATDQRGSGYPRVVDGRIDVGAVEMDDGCSAPGGNAFACLEELWRCVREPCLEFRLPVEIGIDWGRVVLDPGVEELERPLLVRARLPLEREALLRGAALRLVDAAGEVLAEGELREGEDGTPELALEGELDGPGAAALEFVGEGVGEPLPATLYVEVAAR